MTGKQIRNSCFLLLTALIWGGAFVAQSAGGDVVGPFSFNGVRSIIGGLVLLPVIALLDRLNLTERRPKTREEKAFLMKGGISCGIILCIATNVQQIGITAGTPAGKAGFLTACYIILVPIIGIFFHKKCSWNIWVGVILTTIGLYFLCMRGSLTLQKSDLLVFLGAIAFSGHILVIDYFSPKVDGVRMSCIQFFVAGFLTMIAAAFTEIFGGGTGVSNWLAMFQGLDAWIPILYAGILSCGVAYTLQIVGQEGMNPTVASLLLSFESVFSVLAGALILHEMMTGREAAGCVLIFIAVILAQIPIKE